jgi:drug/metabolite transporter (DMT)-like permease
MLGVVTGLLCATTWASGSILMKGLSKKLDPLTLNAPRSLIGGLIMVVLAISTGRTAQYHMLTWEKAFFLIASIVVGVGIGDSLYILSFSRIGVSRAFPISSTYPTLTLIFSVLFLQEPLSWALVLGLLLVTGGVVVVGYASESEETAGAPELKGSGILLALAAAVCWAASMLLVSRGIEGLDAIMVASVRIPALSLFLWGSVVSRGSQIKLKTLSRGEWGLIAAGGLIGMAMGTLLFLRTVALLGPTKAAILTSTSPLFALPLCVIFLKERINLPIIVGSVMTVAGVILVSLL